MRNTQYEKYLKTRRRIASELSPCPGRTVTEREYIARRLKSIAIVLEENLTDTLPNEPEWLPTSIVTPRGDGAWSQAHNTWTGTDLEPDGYRTMMHDHKQRATNRLRVVTYYKSSETKDRYVTGQIIVSPLPCRDWGALPLTLSHWRILAPAMINTHAHWTWVHAVRKFHFDIEYQLEGSFGWYMEKCKRLGKGDGSLWTGQAIYQYIIKKYLRHLNETLDTECQQ